MPIKKLVLSRHGRIVVSFWLGQRSVGWRYGGLVESGTVVTVTAQPENGIMNGLVGSRYCGKHEK
jgi:hypothetical protein